MSIRLEFVHECLHAIRAGTTTTRALCAVYGISEKTGYKWLARFEQGGAEALVDRPHTAARCPHRTPAAHREAIIALRLAHPGWGARKLRKILSDEQPTVCWPAPSTITTLLAQEGLVVGRPPRRPRGAHPSAGRLEATAPNTVWTADYKGEFKTQDGQWCWPSTTSCGRTKPSSKNRRRATTRRRCDRGPRAFPRRSIQRLQVRRVSIPGMFHWRSAKTFLTSALAHEPIGLTPHGNTDGLWDVYFSALWLGTFDERTLTMTDSPPSPVSPIHPV